jgi:hypothetical protein
MRFNLNVYPFGLGRKKKTNHLLWKVAGGAALAAAGVGAFKLFPNLKRYLHLGGK